MVKPETILADGPGEPGERHRVFLTLHLQGYQGASRGTTRPQVFSILFWGCRTSLANSSTQERDDPSPSQAPGCCRAISGEHSRRGVFSRDPPLQCWSTGESLAPHPTGRGPWSHCTYWVPQDRGDTAP